MIKQIVLQLDDERFELLVKALARVDSDHTYTDKQQVIAEQLKGLVTTQWTGSREVVKPRKESKPNYHQFVNSTNLDGTPNTKRCGICHRSAKHWLHFPDEIDPIADHRLD